MTYPQNPASKFVTDGQNVWRLNTELVSAGDIFELDAGCNGFALGPNSDVSRVRVSYYDAQGNPSRQMSEAILSPDRNFIARVDARLDQVYAGSSVKGRILVYVDEVFDSTYLPIQYTPASNDVIQWFAPRIDVMAYFDAPPSVIPPRSDGSFELESASVTGAGNSLFAIVPYYGRKFGYVEVTNLSPNDFTFSIRGVTFHKTPFGTPPYTFGNEVGILAPAVLTSAGTDSAEQIIRASANGMFDALILEYTFTAGAGPTRGPFPTRIFTSDDAL